MLQVHHWEHDLLDLANQALDSGVSSHSQAETDQAVLERAYRLCEDITRENSKTFYLASSLMPRTKRKATQALYAFCRLSDEIVDHPRPEAANPIQVRADLDSWRQQVIHGSSSAHSSSSIRIPTAIPPTQEKIVSLAWADTRRQFHIPRGYVDQLIDGLALDLENCRYQTFADLSRYCYGVACTVGLMSMHISGYSGRDAIPYAIRLGVALQLTNILRDVGEDWRNGRLYLPLEELEAFGLDEENISSGVVDQRWRAFMCFQIDRAHSLYAEALKGIALLHRDGRFAIAAAGELYRGILGKIEENDYNVFSRRAAVSAWGKLSRLPGIWLQSVLG
jgi:15-cis-phytoene synthase